jgi:hypothetical protein
MEGLQRIEVFVESHDQSSSNLPRWTQGYQPLSLQSTIHENWGYVLKDIGVSLLGSLISTLRLDI